ncbi:MAG: hypothetical protein OXB90_10370, partial [Acidimicrobiaceae bacterium]|nr:hypothetical protein [Acidimicrobiaceae bacterium]
LTTTKEPVGTMTEKPKRNSKRKQSRTVAMETAMPTPVLTSTVINNPDDAAASSNDQVVDALSENQSDTQSFGSLIVNATRAVRTNVAENPFVALTTAMLVALLGMLLMSTNSNTDRLDTRINRVEDKIEARFAVQDTKIEARFAAQDAKIEARFAEQDTKIEARFAAQDTKIEARFAEQDTKIEARFAAQDAKFEARFAGIDQRFEQQDAKFEALDTKLDEINLKLTALIAGLNATQQVGAALDGRLLDPNAPPLPGE